jgi:hypothetical protein
MAQNQKWSDLPPTAKKVLIGALVVHAGLIGITHTDLTNRPAEQIRGPKWLWRVFTVANSSSSVVYLLWGRHKTDT